MDVIMDIFSFSLNKRTVLLLAQAFVILGIFQFDSLSASPVTIDEDVTDISELRAKVSLVQDIVEDIHRLRVAINEGILPPPDEKTLMQLISNIDDILPPSEQDYPNFIQQQTLITDTTHQLPQFDKTNDNAPMLNSELFMSRSPSMSEFAGVGEDDRSKRNPPSGFSAARGKRADVINAWFDQPETKRGTSKADTRRVLQRLAQLQSGKRAPPTGFHYVRGKKSDEVFTSDLPEQKRATVRNTEFENDKSYQEFMRQISAMIRKKNAPPVNAFYAHRG